MDHSPKKTNTTTHLLRILALLTGAGIFIYTIHSFGGLSRLLDNLIQLKFYYLLVVLNSFGWTLFFTVAWLMVIKDEHIKIRFYSLLKIKMCGEGVNFMTPLGFIAGDPVRILLLKKYLTQETPLRSVLVDRLMYTLAAQFFCLTGFCLLFTQDIKFPLGLHLVALAIYFILFVVCLSLLMSLLSGHGFGVFERVLQLINFDKRLPKVGGFLNELRLNLLYYKDRSKKIFLISFLCHLTGRFLMALEIMFIFYCYEGHANLVFAVILAALTSFFTVVMGWIPGALGALEYLYAQFFMLYGFSSDIGVSVQIVRRLRVFFWISIGIVLLDYDEIGKLFNKFKRKDGAKITNKKIDKETNSSMKAR